MHFDRVRYLFISQGIGDDKIYIYIYIGNSLPFYPKMLSWSIKIDHDEITAFRIGIFFLFLFRNDYRSWLNCFLRLKIFSRR